MTVRLFCYGTLQFLEVIEAVTGSRFSGKPAVLEGYACYKVRGEVFPGIIATPGARTQGLVYPGIGKSHLRRLDQFECDFYERVRVCVSDSAGNSMQAWTYVTVRDMKTVLSGESWNREIFAALHLRQFVQVFCAAGARQE